MESSKALCQGVESSQSVGNGGKEPSQICRTTSLPNDYEDPARSKSETTRANSLVYHEIEQLCTACSKLDLFPFLASKRQKAISFPEKIPPDYPDRNGKVLRSLGPLQSLKASSCTLCQFFADCIPPYGRESDDAPFDAKLLLSPRYETRVGKGDHGIYPEFMKVDRTVAIGEQGGGIPTAFIYALGPTKPPGFEECEPGLVNYDLMNTWLRACRKDHGCSLGSNLPNEEPFLEGMQLIDCESRRVVDAKINFKYAALSYVWGNTPPGLIDGGRLPPVVPAVIDDAIEVARNLALGYLWVDAYCIKQDAQAKHHQIRNMDRIYHAADITLVSLKNTSDGLPGVRTPRTLPRVKVRDVELRRAFTDPLDLIRHSLWGTRGWTWQESALSQRCLIFTNEQVVFRCSRNHLAWPEKRGYADLISFERTRFEYPHSYFSEAGWNNDIPRLPQIEDVRKKIERYSSRRLTYKEDRLNGFLGMFRAFSKFDPPVYHV